jgi:hypothetical protein
MSSLLKQENAQNPVVQQVNIPENLCQLSLAELWGEGTGSLDRNQKIIKPGAGTDTLRALATRV